MSLYVSADKWFSPAARWIGLPDWRDDACMWHAHPFLFWRDLKGDAWSAGPAQLSIAGTPRYGVFVDGSLHHDGPARGLPGEVFVDRVPLRLAGLKDERKAHSLAIVVFPPTGVTAYQVYDRLGLLAEVVAADGTTVATDGHWKVCPFPSISLSHRLASLPTTHQEHWSEDAQRILAAHEAPPDAVPSRVLGSVGTPPWRLTLQRDVALLNRNLLPTQLAFSGREDSTPPTETAPTPVKIDMARAFNAGSVTPVSAGSDHPNVSPSSEFLLGPDRNIVTLDAGRTRLLRPVIEVLESPSGCRLEVFYHIGLDTRPTASLGFESEREGFVDSLSLTSGPRPMAWSPVSYRGARYVTVRLATTAARGATASIRFHIEAADYPYPSPQPVSYADAELDAIHARSIPTLLSSTADVIVDTCWRENMLWTSDAALTGEAHFVAFRDAALWRRSLGLIARWTQQAGPWCGSVVPSGSSAVILPDQSLQAIIALEAFARRTGDRAFASAAAVCFTGLLEACAARLGEDDLFVPPDWCWHWIDWAPIDRRPFSMPINLLLLGAAETMARLLPPEASRDRQVAQGLIDRLRPALSHFWDDHAGCFRDRLAPRAALPEPNQVVPMPSADYSAHSNALAIRLGIGGPEKCGLAASWLAANLHSLPFGPGFTNVVLGTLIDTGHTAKSIAHLKSLFAPWLLANQPTWSEGFGQTTWNTAHGWGATALMVLERLRRTPVADA